MGPLSLGSWTAPMRRPALLVSAALLLLLAAVELVAAAVHSNWVQAPVIAALAAASAAAAAAALRSASGGSPRAAGEPCGPLVARLAIVAGYSATVAATLASAEAATEEACLIMAVAALAVSACGDAAVGAPAAAVTLAALVVAGTSDGTFTSAARLVVGAAALALAPPPPPPSRPRAEDYPPDATKGERLVSPSSNVSSSDCEDGRSPNATGGAGAVPQTCDSCRCAVHEPVILCSDCRKLPQSPPPEPPGKANSLSAGCKRSPPSGGSSGEVWEKRAHTHTQGQGQKKQSIPADFFVAPMQLGKLFRPGFSDSVITDPCTEPLRETSGHSVSPRNDNGPARQSIGSGSGAGEPPDGGRPPAHPPPAQAARELSSDTQGPPRTRPEKPRLSSLRRSPGPQAITDGIGSPISQRPSPRASLMDPEDTHRRPSRGGASQRSRSICSDGSLQSIARSNSIVSQHGNYVAFVAQVRRDGGGHGASGFVLASQCARSSIGDGSDADLDGSFASFPADGEEVGDDPSRPAVLEKSEHRGRARTLTKTRRTVSRLTGVGTSGDVAAWRKMSTIPTQQRNVTLQDPADTDPGSPRVPSSGAASPRSARGMSLFATPQQRTAEETKETTKETRELVKSVFELDFSGGGEEVAVGLRPFQFLPATTLQKLVVLFGRLAEELDTFRAQQFIVACVCEVMQCDRAAIFLAEWKRQEVFFISDEGQEIHVPMEGSLAGYAAIHRKVLNIKDAYSDHRFNKDVDKRTGYTTRNLLVYPIGRGVGYDLAGHSPGMDGQDHQVIAVIEAINKNAGPFTAEDENILALLGKQAGIHLSNAQTHQQLQLQGLKAQALLEVSKEIADIKIDLGEMMARIMSRARQVLTVMRASIFLIDEEKQELWSILTDQETAVQLGGDNVIRFPVGVGLAGHVAKTGAVLNIADAYKHPLFNPEFDVRTGFVTKAALCVPIRHIQSSNRVMGVMQFINKINGDPFMDEDEDLALSFSSFVAISLNNILLYDELREGQLIREKNRELEMLRDQAQQAAEAKNNFLMAMSHEIRTPMGGVIGMCELLQNTALTPEQSEMTDTIRSCGEALMAIINDVLDFGKLESGKVEIEQRDLDLVSMMEDTVDVVRSRTEAKTISLFLEIAPDVPTQLIGDEYRLRQVLTNLLGNAVKFTPEGGDVTLAARQRTDADLPRGTLNQSEQLDMDSPLPSPRASPRASRIGFLPVEDARSEGPPGIWIHFSVRDTGIGISEEAQRRLFRPFEQAEAGTTRQFGGSGLGLAICKQLVEAMGGSIGIVSSLGQGSTFWFTVRMQYGAGQEQVTLRSSLPQMPSARVLLACSYQRQCEYLAAAVGLLGASIAHVGHIVGLLELVRGAAADAAPHIVVIDEAVEGFTMDHFWEACTVLKARAKELGDPKLLQVALLASMATKSQVGGTQILAAVLSKPPKFAALRRLLSRALAENARPPPPASGGGARGSLIGAGRKASGLGTECTTKLLIAEDNPTNQLLFKKQLQGFGIVPTMCDNGQVAVDTLMEEYHGLVFMDCHMPVLDGYGATRRIRELEQEGRLAPPPDGGPTKPIIIALTADALPDTRGNCIGAGMDDYMTKPLRKATLQQVLEKYFFKTAAEDG